MSLNMRIATRFKYFTLLQILLFFYIVSQSFDGITQELEKFTKDQVHGVKQNCSICHVSYNMQGTGILRGPVSELCTFVIPTGQRQLKVV